MENNNNNNFEVRIIDYLGKCHKYLHAIDISIEETDNIVNKMIHISEFNETVDISYKKILSDENCVVIKDLKKSINVIDSTNKTLLDILIYLENMDTKMNEEMFKQICITDIALMNAATVLIKFANNIFEKINIYTENNDIGPDSKKK